MRSSPFFRMALLLGLLSAIGPFAIDMYLPALPAIGQSLRADIGAVQMSLTAFFISLGAGQLLYGPVSDMVGRKPPLYAGLAVFAIASVGCALATDIQTLIALRFIQGLGAAAGMAIPRAVVRDLHTGTDAARLMSLLMLVFSISPILAPLVGSGVIAVTGWRGVFWAVTIAAVAGLAMMATLLAETRPASERVESSIGSALAAYWLLLRDRHYLGLVFIGSFAMAGFFTYLANSSFVMIDHYGLSPALYSVAFGVNAAAFFGASQFNGALGERFGLARLVKFGVAGCGVAMVAMFAYYAMGGDSLWVMIVLYFIASGFMGFVIPTTGVLALEMHGAIAGTASALLGTLQMLTGAVAMAVVGAFTDGGPLPMVTGMAAGALIAGLLTWLTLGGDRGTQPARRVQEA
ncbi:MULTISPECIES: multidrug effflux MFS transporter [Variovorax]|jgi:MFS transporter, DHA1 family, multidrug resistance protein|uniref:multidrug effflux MFS transporter n=1 Tax=Variovorax TaxID=34072 RepID=UPI0019342E5D|nr:multidrug effflux MFS transporter [Variovorax sp.]QRF54960.1 multidrug effflux MFS transporter [Variovorax paradoxus]